VVGLDGDFVMLNLAQHASLLTYTICLYCNSAIQHQFRDKYGHTKMTPVAAKDFKSQTIGTTSKRKTLFQNMNWKI